MRIILLLLVLVLAFGSESAAAQEPMKFFVTSTAGPDASGARGIGAADEHCALLGYAAGFGDFEWRAFLDAPAAEGRSAVSARTRIGEGPWYNFHGAGIARSVDELLEGTYLNRETAVNERGEPVYTSEDGPSPLEVLVSAKPDANGRYFCFAR